MNSNSTPNYKALCAELVEQLQRAINDHGLCLEGKDALMFRARAALAQPEPVAPTDEDVRKILLSHGILYQHQGRHLTAGNPGLARSAKVSDIALVFRAALARWGTPAIKPVQVSERLPGPEDLKDLYCWWWHEETGDVLPHWVFASAELAENQYLAWLPHWALPMPTPANNTREEN